MPRLVLDTSVFTNPDVYSQFGDDADAAMAAFLALAARADAEFYMPTSVYDELRAMKDLGPMASDFELTVRIRSPRKESLHIPANLLYEFIEEVRTRIDRGLRVAEEHTRMSAGQEVGQVINRLRERYREVLRRGILDSREDADVLLLAYELDGMLVSADEGLRKWADKIGIEIVTPKYLKGVLERLVETR